MWDLSDYHILLECQTAVFEVEPTVNQSELVVIKAIETGIILFIDQVAAADLRHFFITSVPLNFVVNTVL